MEDELNAIDGSLDTLRSDLTDLLTEQNHILERIAVALEKIANND